MAAPPFVFSYTVSTGTPIQNVPPNAATQGETMVPYVSLFQTGACLLAAGTKKVGFGGDLAPIILTPRSKVWFQVQSIGGVAGTHYVVTAETDGPLDPLGVPTGFFVVQAQDTAGALVATDTSTLQWFVMG